MPSYGSVPPTRQPYALFWWCLALALTVWSLAETALVEFVPELGLTETINCSWGGIEPIPDWKWALSGRISEASSFLQLAIPVVLGLCVWLIDRRGDGRPRVHLWTAFAGIGLIVLGHLLQLAQGLVDLMPEDAGCSVDPAIFDVIPPERLAWTFAPALLLLAGAWAGVRVPAPRPRSRPRWRPIVAAAVAVAVAVVAVVVVVVRQAAGPPGAPRPAADGTPRHALVLSGDRLVLLELDGNAEPEPIAAPDRVFYQYTAIARDVVPGRYVAAVTTAGKGARGERSSRIYRIVVDGNGAAAGERIGGDLRGIVGDLAVSPRGRVAYSRVVGTPDDSTEVGATFVGLVDSRGEWAMPKGRGASDFLTARLGLHWRDADTLVFRAVPPGARSPHLVALDTRRPSADPPAVTTIHTMEALKEGRALSVPGGNRILLLEGMAGAWDQKLLLLEPPAKRPVGTVLGSGCTAIVAFTLDASGRYLLVAEDNVMNTLVGNPPRPECEDMPPYGLLRVDLRASPEPVTSAPVYPGEDPTPNLPRRVVWQGTRLLSDIAW
ncbi:hypothetical protein [Streptosporangium sp. NPDC051022]|uniref:hypothetical protein n=1 Tax=Streptosporangium sp. NPDC051022 TaxID=3155752 RepID=UPI003440A6B7